MNADAIAGFWSWWAGARDRFAAAIDAGEMGPELVDELGARVEAIAPGLAWELGPGEAAPHVLVVSPEGDPALRATAERWRRAAPADERFEYHAWRPANPSGLEAAIEVGGERLDLSEAECAFTVDQERSEVDVVLHHPRFAELDERARLQVTFLSLDWLLGERAVELWVGEIEAAVERPAGVRPPRELAAAVAQLEAQLEEGSGVLLQAEGEDGLPILVSAERPLRPARWPLFDVHAGVRIAYETSRGDGLPDPPALRRLRTLEDQAAELLGADGAIVAHETHAGERTLHAYVDGASDAAERLRRWGEQRAGPPLSVDVTPDPGWETVRPFR